MQTYSTGCGGRASILDAAKARGIILVASVEFKYVDMPRPGTVTCRE